MRTFLTLFSTTLLLSISFSSFAYYQLPFWPDKTYLNPEAAAAAYLDILGGGSCKRDTRNFIKASISSINTPHIAYRIDKYLDDQCIVFSSTGNTSVTLNVVDNCPDGTSPDLSTGMCKPKPDTPQYCGTSAMFEDVANLYNACYEQNGIFSYTCDESTQALDAKCDLTTSDQCVIGRPTWPDCLDKPHQPNDPTNPLPPVGGFNPSPVNPSVPSSPVEKPDVQEPDKTETSDTGVINAIKNLNDDLNKSNTDIHNDMNKNFSTMNDALRQLNSTNTAIGQSIVEQMKQDAQIYENNKKLQQQIAANNINAINSQTKSLLEGNKSITGSITGNTDRLVAAVNASGDGVVSAIDGLADKLKLCDPNTDPFNCEGENGLTPSSVESILKQTSAVVTTSQVDAEEGFLTTLKETIDNNLIEDTQSYLEDMKSDLIGALPNSSQCDVDVLKTPYGDFSIGCEYSARLKSILAFVFYIYTLYTLAEILFTGVTPVAGTVPYFSRR
ncbi:receptor-binding protein [Vibrio phage VFJ]|uniref:Receptor-binding protein n=14 Tax=root TaxID=1 RepID=R9TE48_9VIRU|nr:receptor-binding protein [Vibrio phage VFJ]AGN30001.1 receptor-binding protein [Vibrio phage VFJ]